MSYIEWYFALRVWGFFTFLGIIGVWGVVLCAFLAIDAIKRRNRK